jgi:hypothetical protein
MQDAEQIPYYAINGVAEATKANIVVNYPDPRLSILINLLPVGDCCSYPSDLGSSGKDTNLLLACRSF